MYHQDIDDMLKRFKDTDDPNLKFHYRNYLVQLLDAQLIYSKSIPKELLTTTTYCDILNK